MTDRNNFRALSRAGALLTLVLMNSCFLAGMQGVSAQQYGAKGDGVNDDTAALQRVINATTTGTLIFPQGTYRVTRPLTLRSGVRYDGMGNAVLTGTNGDFIFQLPGGNASNITITGFTFEGGGVTTQDGFISGIQITGNTFQNLIVQSENWTIRNAIFSGVALRHSSIDHNAFRNILTKGTTRPDGTINSVDYTNGGIFIYGLDSTSIDHNTFDHVGEGIKVCFSQPFASKDVYIGYNTMTHIHRMGMEIQSGVGCGGKNTVDGDNMFNLLIEYNKMTDWEDFYWNSSGISAVDSAPNGANGVIIRYNLIEGGIPSYPGPYGYGIECAGLGLDVYGNVIAGSYGQSIGVGSASTNAKVHDNYTCALKPGSPLVIGQEDGPSAGASYYNNRVAQACPTTLPVPGPSIPSS